VASNFTVSDVIGIAEAFFLFPLFTLIPGYVCGWIIDAFGFSVRTLLARFAISVPLSIGISPILAYLLWHWSLAAVWIVFGAMWIGFIGLMIYERGIWFTRPPLSRGRVAFLGVVAGWVVLGTFLLIDLQFNDRLYFPIVAYDYTFRTAITAAITRSGIPPHNPYFFPGRPVVLRYHYFWFILCSLVDQIGRARVSPRLAMIAGTSWCGIGLIALIPLYLRFFQPKGPKDLDRRILIGVALLSITGLNILPVAVYDVFFRNFILTAIAVVPWADQVLWVPHHVTALVACLTGFLLIWYRRGRRGAKDDVLATIGAGIMFASGFGLSVYVTFVFAVFLTVWVAVTAISQRFRELGIICVAGFGALALCVPYILELLGELPGELPGGHSNQRASGGPLFQLAIRSFPLTEALISSALPMGWLRSVASTLFLPLSYFLELGFFFLIGFLQWRKMRASKSFLRHPEICGFIMAASGTMVCTFLRSGVISVNDLGIRGFMVVQFILLIWGAELLDDGLIVRAVNSAVSQRSLVRLGQRGRKLLVGTLALGVGGTVYDLCILRSFPMIADNMDIPRQKWLSSDRNLGGRTYALRQLYENLKSQLPQDAVVEQNPNTDPGDLFYGLYADRQAAAETLGCGTVFGGDPAACTRIIGPIDDLFEKPQGIDAAYVGRACKSLSIDALIVKDTDPIWHDKTSWVWQAQPLLENGYGRAFLCGKIAKKPQSAASPQPRSPPSAVERE